MPRFDGTGPGGPKLGRGLGPCGAGLRRRQNVGNGPKNFAGGRGRFGYRSTPINEAVSESSGFDLRDSIQNLEQQLAEAQQVISDLKARLEKVE